MKSNSQKKIFVYIAGQMGNQLFQRTAAEVVYLRNQDAFKKVVALVDCNFGTTAALNGCEIKRLNRMESKACGYLLGRGARNLLVKHKAMTALLGFLIQLMMIIRFRQSVSIRVSNSINESPNVIQKGKSCLLIGYFQNFFWSDLDASIKSLFRSQIGEWLEPQFLSQSYAVAHMRFTDYFQSEDIGVLDTPYYKNAIQKISLANERFVSLSVLTDDEHTGEAYLRILNVEGTVSGPRELEAMQAFRTIASAEIKICANSSFSWWASYLGRESAQVIVPEPWFRSLSGIKSHPPGWTKIAARWV